MILTIKPASALKGKIQLPASKSYSIRSFMIAACGGHSTIVNPSNCDDAIVSMHVARALGARIKRVKKTSMSYWEITAHEYPPRLSKINVKESGTVLRFLLPLLALHKAKSTVIGEGTLKKRPNFFLTSTLRKMGIRVKGKGKSESVPICINGGVFKGGKIITDGSLSSQFISGLLIACPQLKQDSQLMLQGRQLVSTDYITMTCQVLSQCGIKIYKKGLRHFRVEGNQTFKGFKKFTVPSDYGLTAFLMAAAIFTPSDVTLTGYLDDELVQADDHIIQLLKRMGAKFRKTKKSIHIKGPQTLKGGNFSLKNCPDLVPIMSILALFAKGRTCLYNISHVRSKESDRISDLRKELVKIGAKISERRDALIINPQDFYKRGCLLDPHKDHRLAMSFCVLGLKLGARVKDIECTRKSYPDFVRDFKSIGALGS
jgi:3-phosphoshikimate 1-carboxyvinyltransferase